MKWRFGVSVDPTTEVCATIGSKEAVFHVHEGLVDPGDVVLMPSPGYPPYKRGTLFAEGTPWFYPLKRENGFLPDLDAIAEDVARRAKAIWVCYPNSPTGAVAERSFYEKLFAHARRYGWVVLSDEAYSEIWFTPGAPPSALEVAKEGCLAFFSLSKRSAMTGWRVGWVCGDARLVALFRKVKTNIDSGTATFIQDAASAALSDEAHVTAFREEYRQKRDILCAGLKRAGLDVAPPTRRSASGGGRPSLRHRLPAGSAPETCRHARRVARPVTDGATRRCPRAALVPPRTRRAAERIARHLGYLTSLNSGNQPAPVPRLPARLAPRFALARISRPGISAIGP
jgi:DNA-binding transcriptional MocR family regulator